MIENLILVLELLAILLCLANLFGEKLAFNAGTAVLVLAYLFIFTGINEYELPQYMRYLAYVAVFTYCLCQYKRTIKVTIVNFFLAYILVSIAQMLLCIPVYYFCGPQKDLWLYDELGIIIAGTGLFILMYYFWHLKIISDFILSRNWIMIGVFYVVAILVFLNIFQVQETLFMENTDFIQIMFSIILFFLVLFEWQKDRTRAEYREKQLKMSHMYNDAFEQLLTKIRERQHDMKNHISAILSMIYTIDDHDELIKKQKEYCEEVLKWNADTSILLTTGNPLLSGFLYKKIQEAEEKGISVNYKVASEKLDFVLSEYEMIDLLGILFDNAVEALCESTETTRKILIEITEEENEIRFAVANTSKVYSPDEIIRFFQRDYSSKGNEHGIGLKKLRKMVHKAGGEIVVTNREIEEVNYLEFMIVFRKKKADIQ